MLSDMTIAIKHMTADHFTSETFKVVLNLSTEMKASSALFLHILHFYFLLFFFHAEDGIRGCHVTGVQTCALPIWRLARNRLGRRIPFSGHVALRYGLL